jgi:hypothetical protein
MKFESFLDFDRKCIKNSTNFKNVGNVSWKIFGENLQNLKILQNVINFEKIKIYENFPQIFEILRKNGKFGTEIGDIFRFL